MADLKALQLAAQRNAAASRRLEGLDEDYERASALRDSPMAPPGRFGYQSPLSAIATVMRRKRGYKQMEDIRPRRKAVRDRLGVGEGVEASHALEMAMAEEGRRVAGEGRAVAGEERDVTKAAQETEQHGIDILKGTQDAETWVNKETRERLAVIHDQYGNPVYVDEQGVRHPAPEGFAPEQGSGLGFRGKAYSSNDRRELNSSVMSTLNMRSAADDWSDDFAQIDLSGFDLPTKWMNRIGIDLTLNDLMKYLGEDVNQSTKDMALWWANWRMIFTLDKRHELFGSMLSKHEQAAWDAAEAMHPGMPADVISQRIQTLKDQANESLLRRANISAMDGVESNVAQLERAMEGVFAYDPKQRRFSMAEEAPADGVIQPKKGANVPVLPPPMGSTPDAAASALPKATATPENPPITPEEQAMVRELAPDVQAKFNAMPPEQQRALIERAKPTLPSNAGQSALPKYQGRTEAQRNAQRGSAGTMFPKAVARVASTPTARPELEEPKPSTRLRREARAMVESGAEQDKRFGEYLDKGREAGRADITKLPREELRKRENWPKTLEEMESLPFKERVWFFDKYRTIKTDGTVVYKEDGDIN